VVAVSLANVLAFFKAHKSALTALFMAHANSAGGSLSASEARLPRAGLQRLAAELRLVPAMMAVEELQQLATEVSRSVGAAEGADELSYAQFVELLGLAAFVLAAAQGNSGAPMLLKLQLMLLALEASGGAFRGGEAAAAMLRAAAEAARAAAR
jgi:hypothetical protein